jgi:hypothetical protein
MSDYLALAARIFKDNFESESLIIVIAKMPESHCVENIKKEIGTIINELNFNNPKIECVVTNESSIFIRLIKQNELSDFNAIPSENKNTIESKSEYSFKENDDGDDDDDDDNNDKDGIEDGIDPKDDDNCENDNAYSISLGCVEKRNAKIKFVDDQQNKIKEI